MESISEGDVAKVLDSLLLFDIAIKSQIFSMVSRLILLILLRNSYSCTHVQGGLYDRLMSLVKVFTATSILLSEYKG